MNVEKQFEHTPSILVYCSGHFLQVPSEVWKTSFIRHSSVWQVLEVSTNLVLSEHLMQYPFRSRLGVSLAGSQVSEMQVVPNSSACSPDSQFWHRLSAKNFNLSSRQAASSSSCKKRAELYEMIVNNFKLFSIVKINLFYLIKMK